MKRWTETDFFYRFEFSDFLVPISLELITLRRLSTAERYYALLLIILTVPRMYGQLLIGSSFRRLSFLVFLQMSVPTIAPLQVSELRRTCDPDSLGFLSTSELKPAEALIGQERALSALDFGTRIDSSGFNIFVLGRPRTGRHGAIRRVLESKAISRPVPDDWVYVNNFQNPNLPVAMRLPPGIGEKLKNGMAELIDELIGAIPSMFESDNYRSRRKAIDDEFEVAQEKAFETLRAKAQIENIAILRTPMGFALAPLENGQVIKPEIFNEKPIEDRKKIEGIIEGLQEELEATLIQIPLIEKERRQKIRKLNAELAERVVSMAIKDVIEAFLTHSDIQKYLQNVQSDLISNAELFLKPTQSEEESAFGGSARFLAKHPMFSRYAVNVISSHVNLDNRQGAPVIFEDHPTLSRIFGRIDHRSTMGTLVTDFTLIKPGSLHQANGGYLILDAFQMLREPFVWEALKRCLRQRKIEITSIPDELGLQTTEAITPDPIPLNVKVILIGDRDLFYLLSSLDNEFSDLFKVQADFEDVVPRSENVHRDFANLIATIVSQEHLQHLSASAVARLIDEVSREAHDAERLSLRIGNLADLVREANFWALEDKVKETDLRHVEQAISERQHRSERIRERALEQVLRKIRFVDTEGQKIGQVNGLAVYNVGNYMFGEPTRITARVRMGTGKVIDIEREAELGGPIHSKGVLILSGYLASHFALDVPMSLWASLVFEQSYGTVDGDSASSAELYALLSALSECPISQSFAVTGSVNQFGDVQAIGGVNEKIEGFYDLCEKRGLTGEQGVLIPRANLPHLMLRKDIVRASELGRFKIYAVSSIDEGISILCGIQNGPRDVSGHFPPGSINQKVEDRLRAFAAQRQAFGREGKGDFSH